MDKDKKRRELTPEEMQDAHRLSAAWESYKRTHIGATQEWLGKVSGVGSQGVIGQYMRGVIPLNIKALLAICKNIHADPRKISPRLTEEIFVVSETSEATERQDYASDIIEFIDTYHKVSSERRKMLMDSVRAIRRAGAGGKGAAGGSTSRNEL